MVQQALVFYDNNTVSDIYSQLFINNLFGNLTVLQFNDNSLWFIGKEVCDILGYNQDSYRNALKDHVYDEDKRVCRIDTPFGGPQNTTIINESGLYSLILRSKMPNARQFQHWVTSEVLPTMRSIGFTKSMSILREENDKLRQENDTLHKSINCMNNSYTVLWSKYNQLSAGEDNDAWLYEPMPEMMYD